MPKRTVSSIDESSPSKRAKPSAVASASAAAAAMPFSHPPPPAHLYATLYKDALHSIFPFLSFNDLALASRANKHWLVSSLDAPRRKESWLIANPAHRNILARLSLLTLSRLHQRHVASLSCFKPIMCDGVPVLSVFLTLPRVEITHLDLSWMEIEDAGMVCLVKTRCRSSKLVHLNLSCNRIGDTGIASLVSVLKYGMSSLTSLNLSGNDICDIGAASLGRALACDTRLTELNLTSNLIGFVGIASLVDALRCNTTSQLARLDLSNNGIGDLGAASMAEVIKSGTSCLRALDLSLNKIRTAGLASVSEAISCSASRLTSLDLSYNAMEDVDALVVADAVKCNASLTSLDLSGNLISAASVAEAVAQSCGRLQHVDLRRNDLISLSVVALIAAYGNTRIVFK